MGPSEAEIEARLAALRRRREAIDREIADLLLYLELGRRLGGGAPPPAAPPADASFAEAARPDPPPARAPAPPDPPAAGPVRPGPGAPAGPAIPAGGGIGPALASRGAGADAPPVAGPDPFRPDPDRASPPLPEAGIARKIPPAAAFAEDPAGARRYGRALVEAACAVIAQAGRPLHASAILPHLVARGFTLPGADPVAALNTRLWKRAGPGGPLIRLGDAVYALAEASDDFSTPVD